MGFIFAIIGYALCAFAFLGVIGLLIFIFKVAFSKKGLDGMPWWCFWRP